MTEINKLLKLEREQYDSLEAMSFSGWKEFRLSPAHYQQSKKKEEEQPGLGTLVHMAVLEPDKYQDNVKWIEGDFRNKANQIARDAALASGRVIIKKPEFDQVAAMTLAVNSHPLAKHLLTGADKEIAIVAELDGVKIKGRLDAFNQGASIVCDLKTVSRGLAGNAYAMSSFMASKEWHVQASVYAWLASQVSGLYPCFYHVLVEDKAPYGVKVVQLDHASLDAGFEDFKKVLPAYKACLEANSWPSYSEDADLVGIPGYRFPLLADHELSETYEPTQEMH